MSLDARFIVTSDLESYFVDKDSGAPLAAGIVNFYSQTNQSTRKPVYQITSTGTDTYTYTALPNPCILSAQGTFQDALGNNIVPYYYPYTGSPDDNTGIQELYYITVYSANNVLQFTRSGWPNINSSSSTVSGDIVNYVSNGQFISHNNYQFATLINGVNVYNIAQGGWTMNISNGGGGTYTSTFIQNINYVPGLNDFPRYTLNYKCTLVGTESVRDIQVQWPNVNQFENSNEDTSLGTQYYTFTFSAQSNDASSHDVDIYLVKYFGTGGTPTPTPLPVFLTTVTITTVAQYFSITLQFGSNATYTVGTNNDDYVAIALRPKQELFNLYLTDFSLISGQNSSFKQFPVETYSHMLSDGIFGWVIPPNPNGYDLYLPSVLTPSGMIFDRSVVGQIYAKTQTKANITLNELLMDGSTYICSQYSPLGIPYDRLGAFLRNNSPAISINFCTAPAGTVPLFGTGTNFVTALQYSDPTKIALTMNTNIGGNTVSQGTTSFTITGSNPAFFIAVSPTPTAGQYFTFTCASGGSKIYNIWYKVDGSGLAPITPSGANIEVDILSTDTASAISLKTIIAINKYQYMVADLRGYFLRGLDPNASVDPDASSRIVADILQNTNSLTGAYLGSIQEYALQDHVHSATSAGGQFIESGGATTGITPPNANASLVDNTGNVVTSSTILVSTNETRPVNIAVNWFIKY